MGCQFDPPFQTHLSTFLADSNYFDVNIVCEDGYFVKASSLVLAASSRLFEECLKDIWPKCGEKPYALLLQDYDIKTVESLITFISQGSVKLDCAEDFKRFEDLIRQCKINYELTSFENVDETAEESFTSFDNVDEIPEEGFSSFENADEIPEEGLSSFENADEIPEDGSSEAYDEVMLDEDLESLEEEGTKKNRRDIWNCSQCQDKVFYKEETYRIHERLHQGLKPFACEHCGSEYRSRLSYVAHRKRVHGESAEKEVLTCQYCDKRGFASRDSLKCHMKNMHEISGLPFECFICGKRFRTKGNLTLHCDSHSKCKNFICDLCGYQTSSKINLKSHILTHNKDKKFPCTKCSKSFDYKFKLDLHFRSHTGEKPFQCQECGLSFAANAYLNHHISKVHAKLPHFFCNICFANFKSKSGLKRHVVIHSDTRPFECSLCGECFKHPEAGRRHTRSAHQGMSTNIRFKPSANLVDLENFAIKNA